MDKTNNSTMQLDTSLYSRQIGAFGFETMGKLVRMKILIIGLNGCGVEAAKNIILAGPCMVALCDNTECKVTDMCSNFYITEKDVEEKKSRAAACEAKLAELNNYVIVKCFNEEITESVILEFDLLVVSDMCRSRMIELNELCRKQQPAKGFIAMDGFGLTACLFVDFGPEFIVHDTNGDPSKTALVENITQDTEGVVTLHPEKSCPFDTGDYVTFHEVQGMTEINQVSKPFLVTRLSKHSFKIGDTTSFSAYSHNGIVEEKKQPVSLCFESLKHCIDYPLPQNESGLLLSDYGKIGRPEQLHFAIQSVYEYRDLYHRLPGARDAASVEECYCIAVRMNEEAKKRVKAMDSLKGNFWRPIYVDEIDKDILETVVQFSVCHISPIAAFLGGIAAQEVIKYTGKFLPLHQWYYFDAMELLPCQKKGIDESEFILENSRDDFHICLWGKSFQKRLASLKVFLVGAGALGCEYVKSLALMGCCNTKHGGVLHIADMDRIELSNLNRQFLFRRRHIGSSKATVASNAGQCINNNMNVKVYETRVEPLTENIFNDAFWESLDIVVNALDNIKSRQYVDGQCVWYRKPLLESGTLGTKGNVQVILPHITQTYGETKDPAEESIPLCTLRHFPNQIEHTLEWARDLFQGLFHDEPQDLVSYLTNPTDYFTRLNTEGSSACQRKRLEKVLALSQLLNYKVTYADLVAYAVKLFTFYFDHQICQLLHTFPKNHVTSTKQLFWSGPKRAPEPIKFSHEDPLHLEFIRATCALIATILHVSPQLDGHTIQSYTRNVPLEPFVPKLCKIDESDASIQTFGDDDVAILQLQNQLKSVASSLAPMNIHQRVTPIIFEKDDETNFHIDFIHSCANLRARNYKIPECDRYKAQMIAGKIIPAVATTTAAITGFASLEFLKMVFYKKRKIEEFRNAFINLSLPLFVLSEPLPPAQTKSIEYDFVVGGRVRAKPEGFTTWDLQEMCVGLNDTLDNFLKNLGKKFMVKVLILSVGNTCLYNDYLPSHVSRLSIGFKQLVETITKSPLVQGRRSIAVEVSCCDEDGVRNTLVAFKLSRVSPFRKNVRMNTNKVIQVIRNFVNEGLLQKCVEENGEEEGIKELVDLLWENGIRWIATDFDMTMTTVHSHGPVKIGSILHQQVISSLSPSFKIFATLAYNKGMRLCVVTFNQINVTWINRRRALDLQENETLDTLSDYSDYIAGETLVRQTLQKSNVTFQIERVYAYYPPLYSNEQNYAQLGLNEPMHYSKSYHLKSMCKDFEIDPKTLVFLDDDKTNCVQALRENYLTISVSHNHGFFMNHIHVM